MLNIADFYLNMGVRKVKGGGNLCKQAGGRLVVLPTSNKLCFYAMAKGFFTPLLPPHCLFIPLGLLKKEVYSPSGACFYAFGYFMLPAHANLPCPNLPPS